MRTYYTCWYRLDNQSAFFLWYSDEQDGFPKDGVVLDEDGGLLIFRTKPLLLRFARQQKMPLEQEDPAFYNLERIQRWIERPSKEEVDCPLFLNAWNMFGDVSSSLAASNYLGDEQKTTPLYNKLFWGCNLPAMTRGGEPFEPRWEKEEMDLLQEILRSGLQMFRGCIKDG